MPFDHSTSRIPTSVRLSVSLPQGVTWEAVEADEFVQSCLNRLAKAQEARRLVDQNMDMLVDIECDMDVGFYIHGDRRIPRDRVIERYAGKMKQAIYETRLRIQGVAKELAAAAQGAAA